MAKCIRCENDNILSPFDRCTGCIQAILEKPEVIINNVLAYVDSYRDGHPDLKIQIACLKFFSVDAIENAKKVLYKEYEAILGKYTNHIGSRQKYKSEFNMEDICAAFKELDKKNIKVSLVAENVKLLPKFTPEELEITSVLERIISLEAKVKEHEQRIDKGVAVDTSLKGDIDETNKTVENINNEVKSCLSLVNDTRSELDSQVKVQVAQAENKIVSLQTIIEDEKASYAHVARDSRFNARNVGNSAGRQSRNQQQRSSSGGGWLS